MYANAYTVSGSIITTKAVLISQELFPNSPFLWVIGGLIGLFLSFISHFLLDYINEYQYKDNREMLKYQKPTLLIFMGLVLFLLLSNHILYFFTFSLGTLAAMFPDLRDHAIPFTNKKELTPSSRKFSCHGGGEQFLTIGKWHFGIPTIINLTKKQQTFVQYAMTIILIIFTMFIK